MPNPQIYTAELERFRSTYNMPAEYDLNALAGVDQKFKYLNNFLFESPTTANPAAQFVNWVSRTMTMYFEANTNLRADGKYMSGFNLQAFLRDFEKLAKAKYDSELKDGEESTRKQFAGARKKDIKQTLINNFKDLNKTLPTLWAEKLKKGTMTQNDLLLATRNVMDSMDSVIQSNDAPFEDRIINVVAAYEAMKQVRESRTGFLGWLWKFIFRERNEIEQANLETFESQVNQLREKGYPVDKISAEITGKTVLGKEIKIEPVAEKLGKKLSIQTKQEFVLKTVHTLPSHSLGSTMIKFGVEMATSNIFKNLEQMNKEFDTQISTGGISKKEVMANYACKVFTMAFEGAESIGYENIKDTIIATQKIADAVLKEFSPCSLEETGLKEFANGYAVKNFDKILEELKSTVRPELQDKLERGFQELNANAPIEREPAFGKEPPFVESGAHKSAPVHQPPQISAPKLDK